MSEPLVSIVIPCFNHGEFLAEAIDSALGQTYPHLEVVVVDDGSTDDTPHVARGYVDHVRYERQENAGPAAARNTGLRHVRGEFVVFLDADDRLDPHYVERCLGPIRRDGGVGFVYTQVRWFGALDRTTSSPPFSVRSLRRANTVPVSALMRSSVVREIGFCTELGAWEDWDLFLAIVERGYRGELVDEPLLYYRQHTGDGGRMQSTLADLDRVRSTVLAIVDRHRGLYPTGTRTYLSAKYALRRALTAAGRAGRRARRA